MSTVLGDNNLSLRVVCQLPAVVPIRWANTYELSKRIPDTPTSSDDIDAIVEAFTSVYSHMLDCFKTEVIVVSTYVQDRTPYNPETFVEYEINAFGGTAEASSALPLSNVIVLRKQVSAGHSGRALLRGFLREADISSASGIVALEAGVPATVAGWFNTGLAELLPSGASPYKLTLLGGYELGEPTTFRDVQSFDVRGISSKKLNNKWFTRHH